ncbi:DUF2752 domain-containing protein [Christiangramia aquimixticola]|uniref:DUF2752 domain-containing protein n=1 Tax=Christiangramia aquimixticola TaxID=1697558 RepID=UPI003AA80914
MNTIEEYMLPCMNKSLFGVECTGCGGQRALSLLIQGRFEEAFFMYPAIYSLLVLFIFLIVNLFYKFKFDYSIKIGLIVFNAVIIGGAYILKLYQLFN